MHRKIHLKKVAFKCTRCDEGFADSESLEMHAAREHEHDQADGDKIEAETIIV